MLKLHRMKSPRKSHTHLQFAQADTQPKIAKEYVLPTLSEMLTKFKETEGMKKAQPITKAIKNRRFSSSIKACSPFELHRKLKNCASKSPTFS